MRGFDAHFGQLPKAVRHSGILADFETAVTATGQPVLAHHRSDLRTSRPSAGRTEIPTADVTFPASTEKGGTQKFRCVVGEGRGASERTTGYGRCNEVE